jgi:2,5-furandicarboxylate decarboxylase 1
MSDLRSFLTRLKKEYPEEIVVIEERVDADYEMTAIIKAFEKKSNPAVIFSDVRGSRFPVVVNVLGSRKRMALATGASLHELYETWNRKIENLVKPRIVQSGTLKEEILIGDQVDVTKLPIHRYFQEDGGKYIANALMVVKDPGTGIRNLSFSRTQLVDKVTLRNSMHSRGHQWMIYGKAERMNKNLEVAIIIGAHPVVLLAAGTRFVPLELDEFEIAGALLGKPIDLVRCETVDLEVPANAEIVIEGEILAHAREDEGPFGEYTGYASGRSTRNVIKVKAITHRKDAYYEDLTAGNSSEHLLLMGVPKQAIVFQRMKQVIPNVRQMNWPVAGVNLLCFIQLAEPIEDGAPNLAGTLLLGLDSYVKIVVVVDEDINVFDEKEVLWALSTRMDPSTDLNLLKDVFCNRLDPSATEVGTVGKMIINATKKKGGQYDRLTLPNEIENQASEKVARALARSSLK